MDFTGPRHRSSQIVGSNGKSSDTAGAMDFDCVAGNIVTPTFLPLALIACMVGLASVFAGANHLRVWRSDSLSSAASTSLIAWLLTLLAMGVACKEIHTGGSNRQKRLVSFKTHNYSFPSTLAALSMTLQVSTMCKFSLFLFPSDSENFGSLHHHPRFLRAPVPPVLASGLLQKQR